MTGKPLASHAPAPPPQLSNPGGPAQIDPVGQKLPLIKALLARRHFSLAVDVLKYPSISFYIISKCSTFTSLAKQTEGFGPQLLSPANTNSLRALCVQTAFRHQFCLSLATADAPSSGRGRKHIFQFSPWHYLPVDSRRVTKLACSLPHSTYCIQHEGKSKQVVKAVTISVFTEIKFFWKKHISIEKKIFSLKLP